MATIRVDGGSRRTIVIYNRQSKDTDAVLEVASPDVMRLAPSEYSCVTYDEELEEQLLEIEVSDTAVVVHTLVRCQFEPGFRLASQKDDLDKRVIPWARSPARD